MSQGRKDPEKNAKHKASCKCRFCRTRGKDRAITAKLSKMEKVFKRAENEHNGNS